jgi:hypothetical protein
MLVRMLTTRVRMTAKKKTNLVPIQPSRSEDVLNAFDRALDHLKENECDGVVIIMQKKAGGLSWFAPDNMELQTMICMLWKALCNLGK